MKRSAAFLSAIVLILSFSLAAYSVKIDGIDDGYGEWYGVSIYQFVDGESNCGVDFAIMKLIFDNENRALFFCFMFEDPNFEIDNTMAGVSLSIENSEPFVLSVSEKSTAYDFENYSFDGAISINENNGAFCEIRLGIKSGVPKTVNGCVSFIDAQGMPSNKYSFTVHNENYEDSTALQVNSQPNTTTSTSKAEKTTKTTTTKRESRTTRTTTAKPKYTTEKFTINTSPPYVYERTTTVNAQTEKSAEKSTKTNTQKTDKPAVTVIYEKEIIISLVTESKTSTSSGVTSLESSAFSQETVLYSQEEQTNFSVAEGRKYKIMTGVAASVSFVALAVWTAMGSKKQ